MPVLRIAVRALRELPRRAIRALFLASLVVAMHGLLAAVIRADWGSSEVFGGYLILSRCTFRRTTAGTIQNVAAFYYYTLSILWIAGIWLSSAVLGVSLIRAGLTGDPEAADMVNRSLWAIALLVLSTFLLTVLAAIAGIDPDAIPARHDRKIAETPPDLEAELEAEYRHRGRARR